MSSAVISPWATRADLVGDCTPVGPVDPDHPEDVQVDGFEGPELDTALLVASNWLYRLTKYRWPGIVENRVVRPIVQCRCWLPWGSQRLTEATIIRPPFGSVFDGRWWPRDEYGCEPRGEIDLVGPVTLVHNVKVDGVDLFSPADWVLRGNRRLVRTDGKLWPCCQDETKPDTQPGTFSVTYDYGVVPPADARVMCAILACELAKTYAPKPRATRFSARTTNIVREGVTLALVDPSGDETGIPEIDRWVRSVNMPLGGAGVFDPESPRARLTSG